MLMDLIGELTDEFQIKIGERLGDGLLPIFFNCGLEKLIETWKDALEMEGIN